MTSPKATILRSNHIQTVWSVDWPSTMFKQGKTYIVTTYPDSNLIYLETAAKRRMVSQLVASKITPQIKAAIAKARG